MTDFQQAHSSVDTVYRLLAHHRRRYALRSLWKYENPMALADLAEQVAIHEHEAPITEISAEEVKQIYLTLYHTHIPKLADEQFVRYDQKRDSVALMEGTEDIEQYQELLTID